MTFGEKLKRLRTSSGITQEQLAANLSVSKRTIINYESGKCYPKSTEIFSKLASIFNVSIDNLMSAQDTFVIEANQAGGNRAMRQAQELVEEVSGLFAGGQLTPEDRDAVMQALMDAYWQSKSINRKYAPSKREVR